MNILSRVFCYQLFLPIALLAILGTKTPSVLAQDETGSNNAPQSSNVAPPEAATSDQNEVSAETDDDSERHYLVLIGKPNTLFDHSSFSFLANVEDEFKAMFALPPSSVVGITMLVEDLPDAGNCETICVATKPGTNTSMLAGEMIPQAKVEQLEANGMAYQSYSNEHHLAYVLKHPQSPDNLVVYTSNKSLVEKRGNPLEAFEKAMGIYIDSGKPENGSFTAACRISFAAMSELESEMPLSDKISSLREKASALEVFLRTDNGVVIDGSVLVNNESDLQLVKSTVDSIVNDSKPLLDSFMPSLANATEDKSAQATLAALKMLRAGLDNVTIQTSKTESGGKVDFQITCVPALTSR